MTANPSKAGFVEPMLLLPTDRLPESQDWLYELKLDGYRALGIKSAGKVYLRSRNNKDFNNKYPSLVKALEDLPDETAIDGEVVALDESGRPSFNALQNTATASSLYYFVFDLLVLNGQNVMAEPLSTRRALLREQVLTKLQEPVRESPTLSATLSQVIDAVRAQRLEGIVAKKLSSSYESGQRSGSWQKMRINQGQEFVIAGYTVAPKHFDALIFGHYEDGKLLYTGRTRNGFTPTSREQLYKRFSQLEIPDCPFANLPESKSGRWGLGLTAEKMKDCRWLKPLLVGQFEYVEWTPDNHLRHSRFIALREDVDAGNVRREKV